MILYLYEGLNVEPCRRDGLNVESFLQFIVKILIGGKGK